jgi:hypothetical protein
VTDTDGLPGADRILRGLRDVAENRRTVEAMLVSVASRRLRELGLPVPPEERLTAEPELALYELLGSMSTDPYYAFRAALAELDSFLAGLEARLTPLS